MVSIFSLWLPILLSAVYVFIISSIIHMVLPYHRNNFKKLPDEEGVLTDLRKYNIPPGEYVFPFAGNPAAMKSPEYLDKLNTGPNAFITIIETGQPKMGKSLLLWFVYSLVVGICAAYISSRALSLGAHYLDVFRFAGATAFIGYALALIQNSIWYKRAWSTTFKSVFDGLLYALVTAGTFGWLWPV